MAESTFTKMVAIYLMILFVGKSSCQLTSIFRPNGFLGSHRISQNRQVSSTVSSIFLNSTQVSRPSLIFDSTSNVSSLTDLEDPLYCGALTWNYGWIAVATNAFASCKLFIVTC